MKRLTENQHVPSRIGLSFLGLSLLIGLSGTARAASDSFLTEMEAQSLNPIAQRSTNVGPVLVCGGQNRRTSLRIRGTDVVSLWRSAYHMLMPRSALADSSSPAVAVSKLPHKGPAWGINISHGNALVTVQTKW